MLELKTKKLEVRGLKSETSKKGNVYYNLHTEEVETGEAYKFYVDNEKLFPPQMKKGTHIQLLLNYTPYKELKVVEIVEVR